MPAPTPHNQTPSVAYGAGQLSPHYAPGHIPPPNRLADLDCSRQASFNRKVEANAIAEELLLSWFRDQAQYTTGADVDLTALNRATRILYRMTSIQKTLFVIKDRIKQSEEEEEDENLDDDFDDDFPESPDDVDPDDDPDSSPSDLPPGARTSPSAIPAASANPPAVTPSSIQSILSIPSTSPNLKSEISNLKFATNSEQQTSSDSPHSALRAPSSALGTARAASAAPLCPTLSPDQLDRAFALAESELALLTGQPLTGSADVPSAPAPSATQPPSTPSIDPDLKSQISNLKSPASNDSSNPQSVIPNPQSSPCASDKCYQCTTQFCATRIAVPFDSIKCSGACSLCRKTQTCPYSVNRRPTIRSE